MFAGLFGFLLFTVVAAQPAADVDSEVDKRIESIMALVKDNNFDRAMVEAGALVNAHPYRNDSHMAAFQAYLQAYKHDPEHPNGATYLDKALKHLNLARRMDPEDFGAWQVSIFFWDPKRVDPRPADKEAEKMLTSAEEHFRARRVAEAANALKTVVAKEPGYAPAYRHLAEIAMNGQQWEEAVKYARAGTEADPRDAEGFLLLASIYGVMGQADQAMSGLIRSLSVDPGYPSAWRQLMKLDLGGGHVEHMTRRFPKPVLWIVERGVKEPGEKDWEGVPAVTRPAWKAYIAARTQWRQTGFSERNPTFKAYRYTFAEESRAIIDLLAAWRTIRAANPNAQDVLLDHWAGAADAALLDAAIYMDMFLEEWRQDFNDWKRANPGKFEEYFNQFVLLSALPPPGHEQHQH